MNNSKYRQKVKAGLCGHRYDVNSSTFQQGAWKNLSRDEYLRNKRALEVF